uniref:Uncharacterized protein n=1 Tax=Paramoeba aestuarina TaxID=180227 RepID=A0A7S4NJA3_9EUKA
MLLLLFVVVCCCDSQIFLSWLQQVVVLTNRNRLDCYHIAPDYLVPALEEWVRDNQFFLHIKNKNSNPSSKITYATYRKSYLEKNEFSLKIFRKEEYKGLKGLHVQAVVGGGNNKKETRKKKQPKKRNKKETRKKHSI